MEPARGANDACRAKVFLCSNQPLGGLGEQAPKRKDRTAGSPTSKPPISSETRFPWSGIACITQPVPPGGMKVEFELPAKDRIGKHAVGVTAGPVNANHLLLGDDVPRNQPKPLADVGFGR